VSGALRFYRVMAYVVGVGLLVLVLAAMPLKYLADSEGLIGVVGPLHGFLYMVYLVATVGLAFKARWTPVKTVLVMLAGTVPFVSFLVERRVTEQERQQVS
jgi:integral membrane protein